jgi:protein tyrosine phosphatase (PTP) superfamily phosphohydrolase (DUF442 family)
MIAPLLQVHVTKGVGFSIIMPKANSATIYHIDATGFANIIPNRHYRKIVVLLYCRSNSLSLLCFVMVKYL